ncbi:3,4-dihydroxy-2-butanone-4-phosphate synthase [Candidatus Gottesmanbacteria bacterium]|nr:3,4-dihydroxy-2-butanone-4-phosphate synthase [Candidatus Gottesmanbacteria bacterium]
MYCSVQKAIQKIKQGKPLIMADAITRENEGDLFIPAQDITPELVNFMITHGKGLLCVPLTEKRAQALQLPLMVAQNKNQEYTKCAFTVSVDAKYGIGSGISAGDRARTIQLLSSPQTISDDFVRPGHIFPLIAKNSGLAERQGHTEAALELCRLTKKELVGVICEIIGNDGEMLSGKTLEHFAQKHHLSIISTEKILDYIS